MEIVYKCVVKYKEECVSAIMYSTNKYGKKYPIGRKVTADIGGLFVFKTLKEADAFDNTHILKCETECKPREIKFVSYISAKSKLKPRLTREFWDLPEEERKSLLYVKNAPKGSHIVKSLTPIEKVKL